MWLQVQAHSGAHLSILLYNRLQGYENPKWQKVCFVFSTAPVGVVLYANTEQARLLDSALNTSRQADPPLAASPV
jgi:hypothetical protein